jgi:cellobionic acid phosphorylase
VFIPNYYRGDWRSQPRTAGRSSQLVHTGTVGWFCRILVDGLFGVTGCREGFRIRPRLPSDWNEARFTRRFRGADFDIRLRREAGRSATRVMLDDSVVDGSLIRTAPAGGRHVVDVLLGDSAS